jgi:hypothetical protein
MRKSTVKTGLTVITAGITVVTVSTFCHEWLAVIFDLTRESETHLIVAGLFWGGLCGGLGAVITVAGFFRSGGREARLLATLLFLALAVILFGVLFYSFVENPPQQRHIPEKTITI